MNQGGPDLDLASPRLVDASLCLLADSGYLEEALWLGVEDPQGLFTESFHQTTCELRSDSGNAPGGEVFFDSSDRCREQDPIVLDSELSTEARMFPGLRSR